MDDQEKIHTNPFSKEGLGQTMMDMGVAIAKLTTDMEWVKKTLADIKEGLDKRNEEIEEMMEEHKAEVEKRLDNHERRIQELEKGRSWFKGAVAGLSVITFILALVQLLHLISGGG